jgi:hypothetical protein
VPPDLNFVQTIREVVIWLRGALGALIPRDPRHR